ncbi:MAG: AbrB/MazE/SpoVT family DNA-binding domain-containing protein [Balneolales bacterium]
MLTKLQKIGNSFGIILPKQLIEEYHLYEGDTLVIEEREKGVYLNLQDPDFAIWNRAYRKANVEYKEVLRELAKQ